MWSIINLSFLSFDIYLYFFIIDITDIDVL